MSTTPLFVPSRAARSLATAGVALLVGAFVATAGALPASASTASASTAAAATTTNFTVRVTTPAGAPLATVRATAVEVKDGDPVPGSKRIVATAVKGTPGSFVFSKLRAVPYTIEFAPSGTAAKSAFYQLLGGETEYSRATTFVPSATNTSLDVSLASNAPLTGTVVNSKNTGIKSVTVVAYLYARGEWLSYSSAVTDSKGRYSINDVDPGAYKLEFRTPWGSSYATEFSGDSYTLDAASVIDARLGLTTTTTTTLGTGGTISGVARIKSGKKYYALGSVYAVAYPMVLNSYGYVTERDYAHAVTGKPSSKKGAWKITGLLPGTYQVTLFPNYYDVPARDLMRGSDEREFTVKAGSTAKAPTTTLSVQDPGYAAITVVRGPSYSKPLKGAKVTLTQFGFDGYVYKATTNSKGKVTVGHISRGHGKYRNVMAHGRYDLTVSAPGYATRHSVIDVWDDYGNPEVIGLTAFSTTAFPSQPTITDPTKPTVVGRTFFVNSAVDETWDNRGAPKRKYQWLRDGSPIYGAVGESYTAGSADLGHHLSVRVTVRPEGGTVASAYAHVGGVDGVIVAAAAPVATLRPVISPATTARAGDVLTTTPGTWTVGALRYSYEWIVGDEVRGTERSYTVTAADAGLEIRSRITVSKPGYADATSTSTAITSEPTSPLAEPAADLPRDSAPDATPPPGLSETTGELQLVDEPTVTTTDSAFTISNPGATSPASTASVVWARDGYQVGTGLAFSRSSQDAGALITAIVSYTADDHAPISHTVVVQKGSARTFSGLNFGAAYGRVATAPNPMYYYALEARSSLSFTYQWSRSTGEIAGATSSTFVPDVTDIGTTLTLRMEVRSAYYEDSVYLRTVTVARGEITVSDVRLVYDGYVSPGTVLGVAATTSPTATERSYEWTRYGSGSTVVVSTAPTYQLTAADLGKSIQVNVTFSAANYVTLSRSVSARVTEPGDIAARGPVLLTGGSVVGETLSADATALAGTDVTLTYQWLRDGAILPAATGATYTLERRDFGTALSVRVTAKRPEYTLGSTVSNVIVVGAGVAPTTKTSPVVSGAATACGKLTASVGTWSRGNLAFHYQWRADGVAIEGATHSSYTTPATSVGAAISVTVTAVGAGYADGVATSAPTAAIIAKAGC